MEGGYDILNGVLVSRPGESWRHQHIIGSIAVAFYNIEKLYHAGHALLLPLDVVIRRAPLQTRQPDVLFFTNERMEESGGKLSDAPLEVGPNIAVEVLYKHENQQTISDKLNDYRKVGVEEVWLVYMESETVEVLSGMRSGHTNGRRVREWAKVRIGCRARFKRRACGHFWINRKQGAAMTFAIQTKDKKRVYVGLAALLAIGGAIQARINSGISENSPLAEAVDNGDIKAVAALLQNGADPNVLLTLTDRKIHPAFLESVTDRFSMMEPVAAVFDGPHEEGLLWVAAERNHPEIARLLLSHGAAVDKEGSDGETTMTNAAYKGNAALVKMLLAAGARINYGSGAGGTPLISAAYGSRFPGHHEEGQFAETMRLLIAAGANVNLPTATGETPLHCTQMSNRGDLAILLSKAGAK